MANRGCVCGGRGRSPSGTPPQPCTAPWPPASPRTGAAAWAGVQPGAEDAFALSRHSGRLPGAVTARSFADNNTICRYGLLLFADVFPGKSF